MKLRSAFIREGLRDNIPWEQYGYRFVWEAADGEMALPLIRKTKPDVLITDIKMPFMDGLSLSRIVREELPRTKIIIIIDFFDRHFPFQYFFKENPSGKLFIFMHFILKHRLVIFLFCILFNLFRWQQGRGVHPCLRGGPVPA